MYIYIPGHPASGLCSGRGRINTEQGRGREEAGRQPVLEETERRSDVDPEAVQDKVRPVCLPVDIRLSVS